MTQAVSFIDLIRLLPSSDSSTFLSISNPEQMGNTASIAFGGCTLALVVLAAHHTVESRRGLPDFRIYSLTGNFLGPTLADRRVKLVVRSVRDTRTFATRFVTAYQAHDGGQERACFSALVDFQAPVDPSAAEGESLPFVRYSALPTSYIVPQRDVPEWRDVIEARVKDGTVSRKDANALYRMFGLGMRMLHLKQAPTGVHYQNLYGVAKQRPTLHDARHLTDRVSVDWLKSRQDLSVDYPPPASHPTALPITRQAANASFLAFTLDMQLSFIPLTFSDRFLTDAAAVSSLDCALRFHIEAPDLNAWHVREVKTIAGNAQKTYSEARLWDEQLGLVATMTQVGIMRPKKRKGGKL
ncbi:hypothetical protein ACQY0O_003583 [Thecaphora frezii]